MDQNSTMTPYDEVVQTRELQMLKTLVPYVGNVQKKQIVALIQCLEYQHAMSVLGSNDNQLTACSIPEGSNRTTTLLSELKQYCTPGEQEAIDNILNLLCIMENYDLFSN